MDSAVEKESWKITMSRAVYKTKLSISFNKGRVAALHMLGKTPQEIVELLQLNESTVRCYLQELEHTEKR